MYMCVRDIEFTHLYDFLLNAGTVLTFCYFIIGYEKNPAELQLLNKNKNMVVIVFRN
jgi:hypothetical protein